MVGIHDGSHVLQVLSGIFLEKKTKIFVMVVGNSFSVFVYSTTKNGMCQLISSSFNFPSPVDKCMASLSCNNRVQHNTEVTTCRILHSRRNIHTADSETVLLILNRTCSYSNIGKKIGKVTPVLWVKHLVRTGKSALLNSADVHFTDGNKTGKHIRFFLRIWLVYHSFITLSGSTGFICINTRND